MNNNNASREAIEMLGVDPDNLGCVMLNVEMPSIYREVLNPDWAYKSPTLSYVDGYNGQPHITLLYGLLFSAHLHNDLVYAALDPWTAPPNVWFPRVDAFDLVDELERDERVEYSAIVLKPTLGKFILEEANGRLRALPHVDLYPIYDPHITVGYVLREHKQEAMERLWDLATEPFETGDLDFGD